MINVFLPIEFLLILAFTGCSYSTNDKKVKHTEGNEKVHIVINQDKSSQICKEIHINGLVLKIDSFQVKKTDNKIIYSIPKKKLLSGLSDNSSCIYCESFNTMLNTNCPVVLYESSLTNNGCYAIRDTIFCNKDYGRMKDNPIITKDTAQINSLKSKVGSLIEHVDSIAVDQFGNNGNR